MKAASDGGGSGKAMMSRPSYYLFRKNRTFNGNGRQGEAAGAKVLVPLEEDGERRPGRVETSLITFTVSSISIRFFTD